METKTEDFEVFGDQWVYCASHMRPHKTGWCTVPVIDKLALGVKTEKDAYDKCRQFKFPLYGETPNTRTV